MFDGDGRYVRTLGRSGSGPGEFENPVGLEWDPRGHLWVFDPNNLRYTVFDTAGVLVASYRRLTVDWALPWNGRFDAEGRLHEPSVSRDRDAGPSGVVLLRREVAEATSPLDTFPLPEFRGEFFRIDLRSGGMRFLSVPFSPALTWVFDGRSGIWWGTGESYRLVHQSLRGDTPRIVERVHTPASVTAEDRRQAIEALGLSSREEAQIDPSRIPDTKPAFEWFVLDDDDRLWVKRSGHPGDPAEFDVFAAGGAFRGSVQLPFVSHPRPVVVGDRALGVIADELGVQYVAVYRLVGSAEGR